MEEIKEIICFLEVCESHGQKQIDIELIKKLLKEVQVKQLTLTDVIVSDFCECDGVQDLYAMTGECKKCGKECTY